MADIVLTTLNARYWHSAFGLRCLLANMGDLRERTLMLEFSIGDSLIEVLADILEHRPRIVGIGVYVWNVRQVTDLVAGMRRVAPDVIVVLGGPEVSYEWETSPVVHQADHVITGEADLAFAELCEKILRDDGSPAHMIHAEVPQFSELNLPYHLYDQEDIAHRVIYVEASRGCPFTCEFCLSALEIPVRQADLAEFLAALQSLLDRGARQFKFVDRTFNLNIRVSQKILTFFLDRWSEGLFLHFEMVPDRLPDSLRDLIAMFPPGALQFEIGVQTFNDRTGELISRTQDNSKLEDNVRFLRDSTGVHIHTDLIIGLPGEDLKSFGKGFDRLLALNPHEIQVGVLKRLKGTPIIRHDENFEMVYSDQPPFEILRTRDIDFSSMMRLRHFARTWDLIGNSGNFLTSLEFLRKEGTSVFEQLLAFSDFLVEREQRLHGISLIRLAESLFTFLVETQAICPQQAAEALWCDYTRSGRSDRPEFLRAFRLEQPASAQVKRMSLPARQRRHHVEVRR
ncbi:MAG: B12-binding domain-containing radical SAM protein [Fuerstiella sp.]|nr:B12-binding domain-containing radical SAM protein [Fuerstiella sp.]